MLYDRPETVSDALALLAGGGDRLVLAGGTDLYAAARGQALSRPVVDVTGLDELRGIRREAAGWRIGASTTWTEVIAAQLPPAFDALKAAAAEVGGRQIQNVGTVAGNLCNASPAADGVPPLLVLDAEVELASTAGRRRLPVAAFMRGPRRTDLRKGELVTAILVPAAAGCGRSAFRKLGARRYLVISIAMVAVRLRVEGGRVGDAAVAVGACSVVATRLPAVEARLRGAPADHALPGLVAAQDVAAALAPLSDLRGSAEYRLAAAVELLRRALADVAAAA